MKKSTTKLITFISCLGVCLSSSACSWGSDDSSTWDSIPPIPDEDNSFETNIDKEEYSSRFNSDDTELDSEGAVTTTYKSQIDITDRSSAVDGAERSENSMIVLDYSPKEHGFWALRMRTAGRVLDYSQSCIDKFVDYYEQGWVSGSEITNKLGRDLVDKGTSAIDPQLTNSYPYMRVRVKAGSYTVDERSDVVRVICDTGDEDNPHFEILIGATEASGTDIYHPSGEYTDYIGVAVPPDFIGYTGGSVDEHGRYSKAPEECVRIIPIFVGHDDKFVFDKSVLAILGKDSNAIKAESY